MKKIFITGGAGYAGGRLVPYLLENNYQVTVYDIMYFGFDHLPTNNKNLKIITGDIRDTEKIKSSIDGNEIFLHLACISNDTSFFLDENLSKTINYDCFEPMVIAAKEAGVKRFIYASSSSVYGVSDKPNVTEDHELLPLTPYNKFKGMCEPLLFKHTSNDFEGVIFRPATVCGYSPRMRFDLSVNILTNFGVNKDFIKVFGGNQLRPNLHIDDYAEVCKQLCEAESKKIKNEIFNVGYENMSILDLAQKVKKNVKEILGKDNLEIKIEESNDNRSYHINSDKINKILGYKPKRSIDLAIQEIISSFKDKKFSNTDTFNDDEYFNVKRLKNINAK
ncbi:SDR family oxidoreductase [Candidatus Pelagibacter sp.]|nr:SDR family oxidoreductase [Candidatus Pelagibacter sp.]